MRSDDIFDGVTEIRDDLIKNARRPQRRRSRGWIYAVAAVLAAAVAVGGFAAVRGLRRDTVPGPGDGGPADKFANDLNDAPSGSGANAPAKLGDSGGLTGDGGSPDAARVLAQPVYPERATYPRTEEDFNGDALREWFDDNDGVSLEPADVARLSEYLGKAVPVLLSAAGSGRNSVVSPTDIYMALAMLTETVDGSTRDQLLALLGEDSLEELRTIANRVWNALYSHDGLTELDLANSIWLPEGAEYDQETLDMLAGNYYASAFSGRMGSADYDSVLRDWLSAHTMGMLDSGDISLGPDTVMALATTVYFSAKWYREFDPELTKPGVFHSPSGDTETDFMNTTLTYGDCFWSDNFQGVVLAFNGMGSQMRLILPDEGVSPEQLVSDPEALTFLTAEDPTELNSKMLKIHLYLPDFDVSSGGDMVAALKALGVTDVFDRDLADFTPLIGDMDMSVWVNNVTHSARVKIDEQGCEAAALTVIDAAGAGEPPEDEMDLRFDRPFLFSVMDGGLPVFTGIVNEP